LPGLRSPADLARLPRALLPQLCAEIRDELIEVTSVNGGHLGPNLGVVELTVALHLVFETPEDSFVFDVGHQGYVHKLLTGRNDERFRRIRKTEGCSGFLSRAESPHDSYGAGHAGTALSAALGMAAARDLRGGTEHIVAVLGDAAFSCGITMEALNNLAHATRRLIVVLNDNKWSIARNVGAMARHLTELITNPTYNRIHDDLGSFLRRVPGGDSILRLGALAKEGAKNLVVPSVMFEEFGLRYLGPIDGHDIDLLVKNLEFAKHAEQPVILHVLTVKGRGYDVALRQPERFHGTSPFDRATGEPKGLRAGAPPHYQDVFGHALVACARRDPNVVGITAAMPAGTGLGHLAAALPKQFFDVGIAEEHAAIFAAGMAAKGFHPVCAIYSTFLQRSIDCIIHDVCLQNLPVTFCMDRAGLSPNDGPTHHGLFDIALLRTAPNAIIMQPRDEDGLVDMLHTALATPAPTFIRWPRGPGRGATPKQQPALLEIGRAEELRPGTDVVVWALGPMIEIALAASDRLLAEEDLSVGVVDARFAKPLDRERLLEHAAQARLLVTMEDHALAGGFGSAVLECLQEAGVSTPVERFGWPDRFIEHGSTVEGLRAAAGLDLDACVRRIAERFRHLHRASLESFVREGA
jgi:1-deoxy-D-xylulose-5-phosphate synthase